MDDISSKTEDISSKIIEALKHKLFLDDRVGIFLNDDLWIWFETWVGDSHSFIIKDEDDVEYRISVTKEEM